MSNKKRITTNTSAISANNELIRNLPVYENLTTEVNYQPPVLDQVIEVLTGAAGIGGGSGKYVWEKSIYNPIKITMTAVATGNPCYIEMNSDDIDLTTVTGDFFSGLEGTYGSNGIKWIIKLGTIMTFNGADYTIAYTPSTRRLAVHFSDSTLGTWTPTNVLGEKTDISYVVAYDENAYPNGGTQDGYWYELYTPDGGIDLSLAGITHVAIDKFTLSSNAYNTNLSHSLSVIPTFAILTTSSAVSNGNNSSMLFLNRGTFVKRLSTNTGYWCATGKINNGTECLFGYDSLDDVFANVDSSVIQYYGTTDSGKYSAYLQAGVEYTLITMA